MRKYRPAMAMTEHERFEFDLNGFFIRPAILTPAEIAPIIEQVRLLAEDPEALPPEHRAVPSGPSEFLMDHPRVVDVLHETIGEHIRMESGFHVYRHKGQGEQSLHHGGEGNQAEPVMGYRVGQGKIFAGQIRVVFELTDIEEKDGGTSFLPGSHKTNFPMQGGRYGTPADSPFKDLVRSYSCPAGSALFFTEGVAHGGTRWNRDTPRVSILSLYNHVALNYTRWVVPPAVMAGLPRDRQAWYRPVWFGDFTSTPGVPIVNTHETWVAGHEAPLSYPDAESITAGV